ncbi:MAG: hypothetical protein IPF59_09510 [Ignavibacteria bacterium]|nr:hypothetical protein [Ignavibacteria bacterium]
MNIALSVSCGDVNGVGLRCFAGACQTHTFNASIELAIDESTWSRQCRRTDSPDRFAMARGRSNRM